LEDQSPVNAISFSLPGFQIDEVTEVQGKLVVEAHAVGEIANCPMCGEQSRRVHDRYTRSPRDLPCGGLCVQLVLHVRRFKCENPTCMRKTFAERLPAVVPVHAQRTSRLTATLRGASFELGGEAGARVARRFAIETSGDTILRIMHHTCLDPPETPRVLGMDDWATKKGQHYGTILVDLEQHRPVDLLPDREADTVTAWLQAHPGVEIITRDRGKEYIDGATRGAPDAVQVADRWHLLKNLNDALKKMFKKHAKALRAAAKRVHERILAEESAAEGVNDAPVVDEVPAETSDTPETEAPLSHRQLRFYETKRLAAQGYGIRAIARQLHMSHGTVSRYLQLDEFPKYYRAPRGSVKVAPYMPHLKRRLAAGCYNRLKLWREIRAQGFTGCYATLRLALKDYPRRPKQQPAPKPLTEIILPRPLSASQAAWLLMKSPEELSAEEVLHCATLRECCPDADTAYSLAQRFVTMFKQREVDKLDPWLDDAQSSTVTQLRSFANGLRQDYDAVKAALIYEWSNGPVEGQVNRLKLIKRRMYGRAKFELLRLCVLYNDDS
jgi:transposase